jgi:hypothetical protein
MAGLLDHGGRIIPQEWRQPSHVGVGHSRLKLPGSQFGQKVVQGGQDMASLLPHREGANEGGRIGWREPRERRPPSGNDAPTFHSCVEEP